MESCFDETFVSVEPESIFVFVFTSFFLISFGVSALMGWWGWWFVPRACFIYFQLEIYLTSIKHFCLMVFFFAFFVRLVGWFTGIPFNSLVFVVHFRLFDCLVWMWWQWQQRRYFFHSFYCSELVKHTICCLLLVSILDNDHNNWYHQGY